MTVSIVFPVYNKSEHLPTTLHSLLLQTYRDFELIAVDDGSTDGSGDFLDRLAKTDSRVKVIRQPNAGVSAARNAALDRASAEAVTDLIVDVTRRYGAATLYVTHDPGQAERADRVLEMVDGRLTDAGGAAGGGAATSPEKREHAAAR